MDRETLLNGSGIKDPTAGKAIKHLESNQAHRQPKELDELISAIKCIARLAGYDIEGRIAFRNRETDKLYK